MPLLDVKCVVVVEYLNPITNLHDSRAFYVSSATYAAELTVTFKDTQEIWISPAEDAGMLKCKVVCVTYASV